MIKLCIPSVGSQSSPLHPRLRNPKLENCRESCPADAGAGPALIRTCNHCAEVPTFCAINNPGDFSQSRSKQREKNSLCQSYNSRHKQTDAPVQVTEEKNPWKMGNRDDERESKQIHVRWGHTHFLSWLLG